MAQKAEVQVVVTGKDKASGVLKKIGKAAKGLGIGVAAIGTAAIGMGIASVKSFAEAGDAVQKMGIRTGFSTESLSELRHALDLSGGSLENFETGMKKMARFVDDAKQGLSTATDVMDTLGITLDDFAGKSPEETFDMLAASIASLDDPLAKQNAALELFGRAGTDLLPMLEQGTEGMADMRQEAHDLGLVFDQEAADSAALFNDNITRLQGAFSGLMNELAKAVMPILKELIPIFTDLVKALPIKEIAELVSTLLPPLVGLFIDLLDAIPFKMMFRFVMAVLAPMMKLLGALGQIAVPLLRLLEPVFLILTVILELLEPIIDAVVWLIDKLATGLSFVTGWITTGIKAIFGGADGAIVTAPTFTMVGESGPEAIVPLSGAPGATALPGLGGGGVNIYLNVEGSVRSDNDLIEVVRQGLNDVQIRNVTTGLV